MKLTGAKEYISPAQNKKVVDSLIKVNCDLHDRLLTPHEWTVEERVYETLRIESEEMAILIMQRIAQFAKFRTKNEPKKKSKKRVRVVADDLNNAWDSIQMDRASSRKP